MSKLSWLGLLLSLLLLAAPARAQDSALAAEWQAVITGQVEAFRVHDAPAALSFAASSFKQNFPDPAAFEQAIRDWGYEAIMDSRTHSFGAYQQVNETVVLQAVRFTGPDQVLYEAIYQLTREPDGWRVGGVQLMKTAGMGA
ncbi:MAG: DUF4864 domain-containing protein [Devosia sp.]|uniref:DUF4864 domain-containing protein n=1 Tax=unclassified Devosia TaxID=196773 RepID=UPI0009280210|nr:MULTISPECIES: DUF4864 domain-containing protein [unclassified Devosia]MBL8596111.1 DUF4864 domain-containing protein [Devosia sp.]MBN9347769.1 DUF4864 domain-containing protein [Devosia sp.]OJX52425.1 MAG: hypothetical protein BGO81_09535 [Devosia sp. 66-22]